MVEDEDDLRELIVFNLEREGYECRRAADGREALLHVAQSVPDVVILDRLLPNVPGDTVLFKIRQDRRTAAVPVLMLTAKAEESDALVGLAMGADDYVTKPFSMKLLVARVAALLRRAEVNVPGAGADVLSSGPFVLDAERQTATVHGNALKLTTTEFRLLKALMSADGRLRSRAQLIDAALGPNVAVVDRTIDVHVAALRKKLGPAAQWIHTIRGSGYTWRAPGPADG